MYKNGINTQNLSTYPQKYGQLSTTHFRFLFQFLHFTPNFVCKPQSCAQFYVINPILHTLFCIKVMGIHWLE